MYAITTDSASLICSQQAMNHVPARAVGCFKLPAGRAMSLLPNTSGELRIAHGQVWVTYANAALDASVRAGDHFLQQGDALHLTCGQKVVMEAFDSANNASVYFSWEPDAVTHQVASSRRLQAANSEVRQPLLDLVAALHQAGWALGRLVRGLAGQVVCALMPRCSPL